MCRDVKLYPLGSKFIKKKFKRNHRFSYMTAKRIFDPYNQLSFFFDKLSHFTI